MMHEWIDQAIALFDRASRSDIGGALIGEQLEKVSHGGPSVDDVIVQFVQVAAP